MVPQAASRVAQIVMRQPEDGLAFASSSSKMLDPTHRIAKSARSVSAGPLNEVDLPLKGLHSRK
jgi:hypothetical protein